jgi:hypothetical protein
LNPQDAKEHAMDRKMKFLWMQDVLEHLEESFDQWRAAEARDDRLMAEVVERDLEELRRLCQQMKQETRQAAPRRLAALV